MSLFGLHPDVGGRKTKLPADPLPRFDGPRHRILPPQQAVRVVHISGGDEAAHLRAVQVVAIDLEWRNDLDLVSVLAQPVRAAYAATPEGEVVAD